MLKAKAIKCFIIIAAVLSMNHTGITIVNAAQQTLQAQEPTNVEIMTANARFAEEVPENRQELLKDILQDVPENIAKRFNENGWHMEIPKEDLAERFYKGRYEKGTILASTSSKSKTVYFNNNKAAVMPKAVYHELGHVMDILSGYLFVSKRWQELYTLEKDGFICTDEKDGHSKTNAREYFASCFAEYFLDKERFKQSAPQSYAYMETYIQSLLNAEDEQKETATS